MIIAGLLRFPDWLPHALLGVTFTAVGFLKTDGLTRGTIGGRDKPLFQYAFGTCPTWLGRGWKGWSLRVGLPLLFLAIGLWNLAALAWQIYARSHPH